MLDVVQICRESTLQDHTFVTSIVIQMYDGVFDQMYDRISRALGIFLFLCFIYTRRGDRSGVMGVG